MVLLEIKFVKLLHRMLQYFFIIFIHRFTYFISFLVSIFAGKETVSVTKEQSLSAIRITEICVEAAKSGTIMNMDTA